MTLNIAHFNFEYLTNVLKRTLFCINLKRHNFNFRTLSHDMISFKNYGLGAAQLNWILIRKKLNY